MGVWMVELERRLKGSEVRGEVNLKAYWSWRRGGIGGKVELEGRCEIN